MIAAFGGGEEGVMQFAMLLLVTANMAAEAPQTAGADEKAAPAIPEATRARLLPVFQRSYPRVAARFNSRTLTFEQELRTFLIHYPLKTGEWREARETRGPDRRGILCSLELVAGRYQGAAVLPQAFNERYFETFVEALPSPDGTEYLCVHLSYPDTGEPGFLKEFHQSMSQAWAAGPR